MSQPNGARPSLPLHGAVDLSGLGRAAPAAPPPAAGGGVGGGAAGEHRLIKTA